MTSPHYAAPTCALTARPVTTHRSARQELCASIQARVAPSKQAQTPYYGAREMGEDKTSPSVLNHYDAVRSKDIERVAREEHVTSLIDVLTRRTGLVWTESSAREGALGAAQALGEDYA